MHKRLTFDIETDGLHRRLTRVHLLIIRDIDTNKEFIFRNQQDVGLHSAAGVLKPAGWIEDGLRMLMAADFVVGHNILDFDIPVLEKLYPWFRLTAKIRDTLVLTRLLFSDIKESDFLLFRKNALPGKLIGSHGLKAWGYRLNELKGDFGGEMDEWDRWSPSMEAYACQDVVVSLKLWLFCERQIAKQQYSQEAITIEHRFADLAARITANGFPFNEQKAIALYEDLLRKKEEIERDLATQFLPWWRPQKWVERNGKVMAWREAETTTPSKTLNYKDPLKASRTEGAAFCPVRMEVFKPSSRDQIADRLQVLYGWKPKDFTDTGKPKVTEDILRDLVGALDEEEDGVQETEEQLYERFVTSVPKAKALADFFLMQKRIGQLAEGKNGWLKLVENGKVHGSINSLGAVTRRVTHARPNMSQCPAVRSPYGKEMRSLWTVPEGWWALGTDLSGIEIRCFAHSLAEYDGGAYADIVINGDVHTENMKAFGVPSRDTAKTALYALLYGSGDFKLGTIIGQGAEAGRKIKQGFMSAVPAYKKVVNQLNRLVTKQGWIPALDGGRLLVRAEHKALNTSLQSAGALVAKLWSLRLEERLEDLGLFHGWNGDFAYNVFAHDELFISCRTREIAEITGEQAKLAVRDVEHHFNFRCPLGAEYKIGKTWADVH